MRAVVLALGLSVALAVGCASLTPAVLPGLPDSDRTVLFVADGAGDYRACSASFRDTAAAEHLPLEVVTYVWSHGYLRNALDQTDWGYARQRGEQLAQIVAEHRQHHPDAPIILVGHSAGSAVVLSAAERLPAGSLDRILLLAPSTSDRYDLGPALAACRSGIDVFTSEEDWVWLGVLVRILGTTDNPIAARAAGRWGYRNESDRVRLHRWTPDSVASGHNGGHFGAYQPAFLRRHVFPLLGSSVTP